MIASELLRFDLFLITKIYNAYQAEVVSEQTLPDKIQLLPSSFGQNLCSSFNYGMKLENNLLDNAIDLDQFLVRFFYVYNFCQLSLTTINPSLKLIRSSFSRIKRMILQSLVNNLNIQQISHRESSTMMKMMMMMRMIIRSQR